MIISKKKFNNALREAADKVHSEYGKTENERERERWLKERLNYYDRRMDSAFADIDRRLHELEKKTEDRTIAPVCSKY